MFFFRDNDSDVFIRTGEGNNRIINNVFENTSNNAIRGENSSENVIKNNHINNCQNSAIVFQLGSTDLHVSGNTIIGTKDGSSIYFTHGGHTVLDNRIRGDGASYGISSYGDDVLISNNDLKDSGTVAAIRDTNTNISFGSGNRVNDGSWIVGADD